MAEDTWETKWSDNVLDYVKAAAVVAVAVAGAQAVNSLMAGKQKNQSQAFTLNQPVMPVINFVGDYSKSAGGYVFREAKDGQLCRILAMSGDRLDSFDEFWLADDKITLDGGGAASSVTNGGVTVTDGRYLDGDPRVIFETRLGLPTETAYSYVTGLFPTLWDSTCRGDGQGSMFVRFNAPKPKFQAGIFPSGQVDAAASARGVCYDWRQDTTAGGSGTQRRNTPSTWSWSANPIVWLVHKEWTRWGRDWETQILPVLANLTTQANICDEAIPLNGGGTEPRYRVAFNYSDDEDFATTRQRILDSMDGFYAEDGFGRLILKAGKYEAPTTTFTGADIISSQWSAGQLSSSVVDQINITFINPLDDYKSAECDPWLIGEGRRAVPLSVDGVTWWRQARRLAKRKAARLMPAYSGSLKVGRRGRYGLGQRYILVQNPYRPSMGDVVCEVTGVEYDPKDRTFTYSLISADVNIDAWNPATEEGAPVGATTGFDAGGLAQPTITSATAVYNDLTTARIVIVAAGPSRTDIVWTYAYQVDGDTGWTEVTDTTATGGTPTFTTGTVPVNKNIKVRVEYQTGSSSPSDWSATSTVSTSTAAIAPAPPTNFTRSGGVGSITTGFINPTSANLAGTRVYRGATGSAFGSATAIGTLQTGLGATISQTITGQTPGTYDLWIASENASGVKSTPVGPLSVTVT